MQRTNTMEMEMDKTLINPNIITLKLIRCSKKQKLVHVDNQTRGLFRLRGLMLNHLPDVLDNKVSSVEAPFHNLKDRLLTSWCKIPQVTFRGLVESMPPQVRVVLTLN